jgi:hypothetical protein
MRLGRWDGAGTGGGGDLAGRRLQTVPDYPSQAARMCVDGDACAWTSTCVWRGVVSAGVLFLGLSRRLRRRLVYGLLA